MRITQLELKTEISKILSCDIDKLLQDAGLDSHPTWDSIAHIDIMLFLSEKCGIEISDQTIEKYSKLENILLLGK